MKSQLNNDICRCYGKDCDIKESCKRSLTIAIDKPAIYSYAHSLHESLESKCAYFIEDDENDSLS